MINGPGERTLHSAICIRYSIVALSQLPLHWLHEEWAGRQGKAGQGKARDSQRIELNSQCALRLRTIGAERLITDHTLLPHELAIYGARGKERLSRGAGKELLTDPLAKHHEDRQTNKFKQKVSRLK